MSVFAVTSKSLRSREVLDSQYGHFIRNSKSTHTHTHTNVSASKLINYSTSKSKKRERTFIKCLSPIGKSTDTVQDSQISPLSMKKAFHPNTSCVKNLVFPSPFILHVNLFIRASANRKVETLPYGSFQECPAWKYHTS